MTANEEAENYCIAAVSGAIGTVYVQSPLGRATVYEGGPVEAARTATHIIDTITSAIRKAREEIREKAAKLCSNPYSDDVRAMGQDEPFAVGNKIARAIRALPID